MTQLRLRHGRRVLIIEDEFLSPSTLKATMFKLGFDVCPWASAEQPSLL